jgi:glyoxylase-like metal-dependent hydrolase (beta-lactamase superfamily II)
VLLSIGATRDGSGPARWIWFDGAEPTPGWKRFEGFLWRTTSLLVLAEGESLVVDPAISADEVAGIARRALELGAPVRHVLVTHGDWDHVCGIGGFSDAVVAMGEETGEKVASGAADKSARRAAEHYKFVPAGSPRVDQTFRRGLAVALGPFVVETFPLVGHTADGSGFRLREQGLLIVGDYLSAVEFPFATSPTAYRITLAGLIEMLRKDPPDAVIPGHGPPLEARDALSVRRLISPTCAPCTRLSLRLWPAKAHATKRARPVWPLTYHESLRPTSRRCAVTTSTGRSKRSSRRCSDSGIAP